ncbi:MAG TPA: type II secretion system protein N [Steroidobacteraceae bacterium]|nr:type II secretion system protein N [Steroidobacteraceae bacterium]
MKRTMVLIVLAVLAFAAILIARLPASWVIPSASAEVGCAEAAGTIWNGNCIGLTAERQALGDLSWELHPVRLLAARIDGDIVLTHPAGSIRGSVEIGFGKLVTARNVRANLTIDPRLIPQLPPSLRDLRGTLNADIVLLRLQANSIRTLAGTLEVHDLQAGAGNAIEQYGSYSLSFPGGGGAPVGQLRDLGGPLAVEGSVRLIPGPGFDLQGLVAARPTASPQLVNEIRFLGSPDAQGRRPFALEMAL